MNHHSINLRVDDHKQAVTYIRELRQFESMYIMQKKLDTHGTYTLMISRTRKSFTLTQQSWMDLTASEKLGFLTTSPAHRLIDARLLTQFLSPRNH
jgi:hypothetical protein